MKQLLCSLVLTVIMVVAVNAAGPSASEYSTVTWADGIDSLEVDGIDTSISDTFYVRGYGYSTYWIAVTQANDSIDIDSVILELSPSEGTGIRCRETFMRPKDINGDIDWCFLDVLWMGTATITTATTTAASVAHPSAARGRIIIYQGGDTGTATKTIIWRTQNQ